MAIDYHKNTTTDAGDYIVSHSQLCKLDPNMGGHPKLFYKALNEPVSDTKSLSMERGDLLHLWIEKKDQFIVSELDKPTEKLALFIEKFHELYTLKKYLEDPIFLAFIKQDSIVGIAEQLVYNAIYKSLWSGSSPNEEEFAIFVACVRYARKVVNYQNNWGEAKILEIFTNNISYVKFLRSADGKIALTPATRDILTNCHSALQEHPLANYLLFKLEGLHELELVWNTKCYGKDGEEYGTLNRRAKLDKCIVDEENKELVIIDVKTTSLPVSLFVSPNGSYWKYGYGRQLVNYSEGFFATNKRFHPGEWKVRLYNVVVQTQDEYPVMVFETGAQTAYQFRLELSRLELRAAQHIQTNQFNISMDEIVYRNNEIIYKSITV